MTCKNTVPRWDLAPRSAMMTTYLHGLACENNEQCEDGLSRRSPQAPVRRLADHKPDNLCPESLATALTWINGTPGGT